MATVITFQAVPKFCNFLKSFVRRPPWTDECNQWLKDHNFEIVEGPLRVDLDLIYKVKPVIKADDLAVHIEQKDDSDFEIYRKRARPSPRDCETDPEDESEIL